MDLGQKMIDFRMKNLMTQRELAIKTGLCAMTVSRIENNKTKVSKLTEARILKVIESEE